MKTCIYSNNDLQENVNPECKDIGLEVNNAISIKKKWEYHDIKTYYNKYNVQDFVEMWSCVNRYTGFL